jgi:hypothetical protein
MKKVHMLNTIGGEGLRRGGVLNRQLKVPNGIGVKTTTSTSSKKRFTGVKRPVLDKGGGQ